MERGGFSLELRVNGLLQMLVDLKACVHSVD
jgi:hypothetical protein